MLITLIVFFVGVFLGAFVGAIFDFGIKIQFITGKSALPDWNDKPTSGDWPGP